MLTGFVVVGFVVVLLVIRMRRAIATALCSAAGGLAALGAVNLTALLTGIALPLNLFSILVCTVLGAPGVVGMLVLRLFW